jgi:hypothetical protein
LQFDCFSSTNAFKHTPYPFLEEIICSKRFDFAKSQDGCLLGIASLLLLLLLLLLWLLCLRCQLCLVGAVVTL